MTRGVELCYNAFSTGKSSTGAAPPFSLGCGSHAGEPLGGRDERDEMRRTTKRDKQIDQVVGELGKVSDNAGLVKNDAAKRVAHLMGIKTAEEFGETIEELKRNPQQYSMVFKDGGLRLRAIQAVAEHGRVTEFPTTVGEVASEFDGYMNWCYTFMVAPTIGMFSTWLGVSLADYDAKTLAYELSRPDVADELKLCKETLRGFLETQALDSNIPPAVYLHQNKAYFGAVETSEVTHVNKTEAHVRDSQKIDEVINAIPIEE